VAFAVREAVLRPARLRAVRVRPAAATEEELAECRRLLAEYTADRAARHPGLDVVAEVVSGHPVRQLALVSQSALALIVGRGGGSMSTTRGLLDGAGCPVITVPPS
ncbi:universal stress protein, partial [Streptomyces sp. SID9124]|uniref:universal stress protein n=1 Tax=Streptomyces sp. SID9124 TaxID=2706108 RepID=UPI0013DFB84D